MVIFGSFLSSSTKKPQNKPSRSWTPSGKTFWGCAWTEPVVSKVQVDIYVQWRLKSVCASAHSDQKKRWTLAWLLIVSASIQSRATHCPRTKRHSDGVSLAGRKWPDFTSLLGVLCGIKMVLTSMLCDICNRKLLNIGLRALWYATSITLIITSILRGTRNLSFFSNISGWEIIIQFIIFFMKSDILNIHLTNLINKIDDSINSLNVHLKLQK